MVQSVLDDDPHDVPDALCPPSTQTPAEHVSCTLQTPAAAPQVVPSLLWFAPQTPAPLHVSALVQSSLVALPQLVPADLKPPTWQTPAWQTSASVHAPAAAPQLVPLGLLLALHTPAALQVSAPVQALLAVSPQVEPTER